MEPSRDDIAATLRSATGFRKLSDADREGLIDHLSIESQPAAATLVELGRVLEHVYIVHSGSLEIRSATGKVFARLKPGDVLGARAPSADGRTSYRSDEIRSTDDRPWIALPIEPDDPPEPPPERPPESEG